MGLIVRKDVRRPNLPERTERKANVSATVFESKVKLRCPLFGTAREWLGIWFPTFWDIVIFPSSNTLTSRPLNTEPLNCLKTSGTKYCTPWGCIISSQITDTSSTPLQKRRNSQREIRPTIIYGHLGGSGGLPPFVLNLGTRWNEWTESRSCRSSSD